MLDSFVVEANRRVVGIAIRCRGGYKFHASEPEFRALDKQTFRRAKNLAHGVAEYARKLLKAGDPAKLTLH
ncbi:hypothetical protein ACFFF7_09525 [Novosphingobium aquiterrae]|uniref:Uncharacterized protein n=1 Tax=Novosphingobium aquiterrae TaxID=624388 RepID=A0ABV6PIK3_9SPHN